MRKLLLAIVLAPLLAACATGPNPNVVAAQNICAIAYGDPALNPIRDRIPFDDDQAAKASMTHLADVGKPNAAERAALRQYDAANRRCWDAWDKVGTSPIVQEARANVSAALAELINGSATYGEFNRRRSTAVAEMKAELQEARERERAAYYYRHARRSMFCDPWFYHPYSLHCF